MGTVKRTDRMRAFIAAGTAVAMGATLAVPTVQALPDTSRTRGAISAETAGVGAVDLKDAADVSPRLSADSGPVSVFVQTRGTSALETGRQAQRRGLNTSAQRNQIQSRAAAITSTTRTITAAARSLDADTTVLYDAAYTLPGVALRADAAAIRTLAARSDVVRITPIARRTVAVQGGSSARSATSKDAANTTAANTTAVNVTPANAKGDTLVGANTAWAGGTTGTGVNIAVIDTGVDYTHKDFGGPGTPAAYETAQQATTAPNPAWFDANKYRGGYDFAGTDYDANDPQTAPVPDANPIDGLGGEHGTHVAGTAAGYGVTTAGATYTGSYTGFDTPNWQSAFSIAPGSAPEAGLFALKVFGDVAGSTDLVGAALEWIGEHNATAAPAQRIDIANLSLGGDYAPADDPENLMVDELTASGVLMVIAAGNAGDITDVSGAPGNARSALTVAASSAGGGSGPVDTPAYFTSRGGHGSYDQIIKPDVTAPGTSVISAGVGSGAGSDVMSGTSMATPLTAGVAALAKQAHPSWDALRLKTQIINTATHDLKNTAGTLTYAPLRVGTGRIDAPAAVSNEVLAASVENGSLVTASFGVLEVSAPLTRTRSILVSNTSAQSHTYDVTYLARTVQPGVTYTVSPSQITVPAGQSSTVTVTLTINNPAQLRRTIDPTQEVFQQSIPRQFVSDASGVVQLTPQGSATGPLRISVFAAAKPVSAMSASNVNFGAGGLRSQIDFVGQDVYQGSDSQSYASIVAPLVLGTTDPIDVAVTPGEADQTLAASDIVAVGASSTAPQMAGIPGFDLSDGLLTIGVATAGNWAALTPMAGPVVYFDTNGDGQDDYYTYVTPLDDDIDLPVAVTVLADGSETEVDVQAVNIATGQIDTNIFDTNVMLLPVSLGALGYSNVSQHTSLRYRVEFENYYAAQSGYVADATGWSTFDVKNPSLWFGWAGDDAALYDDWDASAEGEQELPITRRTGTTSARVLLLHLHNSTGSKVEILNAGNAASVSTTTATSLTLRPAKQRFGLGGAVARVVIATTQPAASGRVEIRAGTTLVATAQVPTGQRAVAIALGKKLAVGKHNLTARFIPAPSASLLGSTSTAMTLTVQKAKTSIKVKAPKRTKKGKAGKRFKARITVKAKGVKPSGRAVVRQGKRIVGKAKVKNGKVVVKIKTAKVKTGKRAFKVTFKATKNATKSTKKFKVTVRR